MVPEKVGLKAVQRDNVDYEFTAVLDIAMNHKATTSKDRTGLFTGRPEFTITPAVGQAILKWCNMGTSHATESFHTKPPQPCFQPFSLNPNWPQG